MFKFTITAAALVLLCGCPAPVPPHPELDGAVAGTPENACANLVDKGCVAGADAMCATVYANVLDAGLTKVDLACIANASTHESIAKCAGASCE